MFLGSLCRRSLTTAWLLSVGLAAQGDERERLFENQVRPLLLKYCVGCHGEDRASSGLRVDSRDALIQGGDSGSAIVPYDADASLL